MVLHIGILIFLVLKIMGYIKWSWILVIILVISSCLLFLLFQALLLFLNNYIMSKDIITAKIYLPNGEILKYVNIISYSVSSTETTLNFYESTLIFSNVSVEIETKKREKNWYNR